MHPGLGVTHQDHARGDEAATVLGRMAQNGELPAQIDIGGVDDDLLRRTAGDPHGFDRVVQRPLHHGAHLPAVQAQGGLAVLVATQEVAEYGHLVAVGVLEQQRRSPVARLHDAGHLVEQRQRLGDLHKASGRVESRQRGTEGGVDSANGGVSHRRPACSSRATPGSA